MLALSDLCASGNSRDVNERDDDVPAFDRELVTDLAQTRVGKALRDLPIRYFHATLEGAENIPRDGGALLVGNHSFLGIDGFVLGMLVLRETQRLVRFLGEKNLWKIPGLGGIITALGVIPGEPDAATALLTQGEIVAVYPGGIDDSFKSRDERYRLKWGARAGFARIAMRARVPIVPVAAEGIDEAFTILGRERWLGRRLFGSPRYDIPIALGALGLPIPIPKRAPQRYRALACIDTRGDVHRPEDVDRVRLATWTALDAALREARNG